MSDEDLPSPCIGVCALDEKDICQGCFRSGNEITEWFMADNERKHEILKLAVERNRAARTVRLG